MSMQFSVAKSKLSHALSLVAGVVEKKTTVPILSNVKLDASADGLTITGTDLEAALTIRVDATVVEPGVITLPAKKLADFVRLLPDGDIAVKLGTNDYATVTAGRSRSRIAGMSAESFPELPATPEPMARIDAPAFARLLARVSYAISAEESRFTLNGALVEIEGSLVRAVATDGHRLAWAQLDGSTGNGARLLMPKKAIVAFAKIAGEGPVDIGVDENHLFFTVGDCRLVARKLTGNFPDYKRIMPSHDRYVSVDRAAIASALGRVMQFSDERSRAVRFTVSEGEIKVFSSSVESGESDESVTCEGGFALEVGFNAQYIMEALAACEHGRVALYLKDDKSAGEIRPMTEQEPCVPATDYRVVVMPMRI